jgi:RNA polymerase sigma-70 factor (ECF subfamily)
MTIAQTQTTTANVLPWQGPTSPSSSDETLIQRIAGGDQLAMRTFFARHQIRLLRFLVRIVRNQTVAEDLLSDVFLDVWRKAGQFEGRSSVSTWLLAIGRLKALSTFRLRADVVLNDEMASTIVDPADDPETVLEKKNSSEFLRQCVTALSPAQSQIIELVYYRENSVGETAKIVGIPEATVKTRMFYARKQLATLVMGA